MEDSVDSTVVTGEACRQCSRGPLLPARLAVQLKSATEAMCPQAGGAVHLHRWGWATI